MYEKILYLCNQRGIKPGKICADTGLSRGMMTDLKMGRTKSLSAKSAKVVADYFGVSVGYLIGEEDAETQKEQPAILGELSDDKIKLIKRLDHLSEEKIRLLLQVAESLE
jgi:transcriptional regulator with XRE-family HTH domain